MIDFRMETFLTVCHYMNFTKAAEALHITQPAVSQHIRWIEHAYQVTLFTWQGKKMTLTLAGQLLLSAVASMKHDTIYLKERLRDLSSPVPSLSFGTTLTIAEYVMPQVLENYKKFYPDVRVNMLSANTHELLKKIDDGEIDFAIVEGYFTKNNYDHLTYSREPYIPICSASYYQTHFSAADVIPVEALFAHPLLLRETGSGTREILEKHLSELNFSLNEFSGITEIGNMTVLKHLTCQSFGISFLYKKAVERELACGMLRELPVSSFPLFHDFTFIWRKNSIFTDHYRTLFSLLQPAQTSENRY